MHFILRLEFTFLPELQQYQTFDLSGVNSMQGRAVSRSSTFLQMTYCKQKFENRWCKVSISTARMHILCCVGFKTWEKGWKISCTQTYYLGINIASLTKICFKNVNWRSIHMSTKKGQSDYHDNLARFKLHFK